MLKDLLFSYGTVIQVVSFTVLILGLYYKMKIDMKGLDLKIIAIQLDRNEKWNAYDKKQEKQDECLVKIMEGINKIGGDVGSIKTDIDWLKKKK